MKLVIHIDDTTAAEIEKAADARGWSLEQTVLTMCAAGSAVLKMTAPRVPVTAGQKGETSG